MGGAVSGGYGRHCKNLISIGAAVIPEITPMIYSNCMDGLRAVAWVSAYLNVIVTVILVFVQKMCY